MNTLVVEVKLLEAMEFSANRHRFQRRKDEHATPYINHPIQVAYTCAAAGESDLDLLMAALLHDTIEDTETTYEELCDRFGSLVADLVIELTDDKLLSAEERKIKQVASASQKSEKARKIKLADKICNVNDMLNHPPHEWSIQRRFEYIEWSKQVVDQMKGTQSVLENRFRELYRQALEKFPHHEFTR